MSDPPCRIFKRRVIFSPRYGARILAPAGNQGRTNMVRLQKLSWLLGTLMLAGLGCLEEFNTLKESQMPRVAEGGPPGSGHLSLGSPVDRFNARALWDEYVSNGIQADLECKGKTPHIEGVI